MRIRGRRKWNGAWARIRGQLNPGPTVLFWHRVAHLPQDPLLLAVTPEHFEEQLLALRRAYQVVSLAELMAGLARGIRLGPVVALTFDDGYEDNATTALPLLKKHGVPATFYLASGFVGTAREYLASDIERILWLSPHCPDELHLTVDGRPLSWTLRSREREGPAVPSLAGWNITFPTDPTPRHRAHREIHGLLRTSPPAERERVLAQLRSQCGETGPARPTHRPMSWDQARDMAGCELVELGAHTVNHPWLSSLSPAEQRREILNSKRFLEEQIGRPVVSFAYPYGTRESYTMETVCLVKEVGFKSACTTFRERVGGQTDPYQLPRQMVRDWDGKEFLHRLKAGRR